MAKVLVAEDELQEREHLARILGRNGHEVRCAATGSEAIDVGSSFRPDILVVDWMLKSHINGLHVANALQTVDDKVRTILISGFPLKLFSDQMMASDALEFFEKPLEIGRLLDSVNCAAAAPQSGPSQARTTAPGVVEMNHAGEIVYANERARALFSKVIPDRPVGNMHEICHGVEVASFLPDRMRRIAIRYESGATTFWRVCVRNLAENGNKLLMLLPERNLQRIDRQTVRLLLGFPESSSVAWPLRGMTLVVDADMESRRLTLAQLRRVRAKHMEASSAAEALQVMRDHPRVDLVIFADALGQDSIRELLPELDARHRGAIVIGLCLSDVDDERLRALGVANTLKTPWDASDLLDIVTGRL